MAWALLLLWLVGAWSYLLVKGVTSRLLRVRDNRGYKYKTIIHLKNRSMENFLILLLLFGSFMAFVVFIIGMFNPKTVKCQTRGRTALIYLSVSIGCFFWACVTITMITPKSDLTDEQYNIIATEIAEATSDNDKNLHSQETSKSAKEVESSIGKPIQIGYFIYKIQNIQFRKTVGNEYFGETADGIYMLVNLSIKNISNETRTLDGSFFAVTNKNGVKYEFSTDASTALEFSGGKTLFLKKCQPNITTKGTLIFEVPQKDEYYLHLIGSFWGEQSVRVLLK